MIFVTLGTHELAFKRLLNYLEEMDIKEEVVIQSGNTKFDSKKYKIIPFLSHDEFDDYIKKSELVITHGGVGSILNALKNEKKVIAMPRLSKFKEHNDDHQIEICEKFDREKYIISCQDFQELKEAIYNYRDYKFIRYPFNNERLIDFIVNTIDNI